MRWEKNSNHMLVLGGRFEGLDCTKGQDMELKNSSAKCPTMNQTWRQEEGTQWT